MNPTRMEILQMAKRKRNGRHGSGRGCYDSSRHDNPLMSSLTTCGSHRYKLFKTDIEMGPSHTSSKGFKYQC